MITHLSAAIVRRARNAHWLVMSAWSLRQAAVPASGGGAGLQRAENVALRGKASLSTTDFGGTAERGNDGNTNGHYYEGNSVFHTALQDDPWWGSRSAGRYSGRQVVLWNGRWSRRAAQEFEGVLLDENRKPLWEQTITRPQPAWSTWPAPHAGSSFSAAIADFTQSGFNPLDALNSKTEPSKGWAVGGAMGQPHSLVLVPETQIDVPAGARFSS